jgi:hypothetical protein
MNVLVNTQILPGLLEYHQYRNANVAYLAMAIACAYVSRRWLRLGAVGAMVLAIFATYPSATTVLVLLATGLTLFMTSPRATALRIVVVAGTVVLVAALALANFEAGVALSSRYFALVNKAQTSGGRLDLWSQGIDRFEESPVFGSAFADEVVAIRSRDQRALPFHNDFLLFLAEGGLVGLGTGAGAARPRDPGRVERVLRHDGVQPRPPGAVPVGHGLRVVVDRDVARGAPAAAAGRGRRYRTRGAAHLNAIRLRRWANAQYAPWAASDGSRSRRGGSWARCARSSEGS